MAKNIFERIKLVGLREDQPSLDLGATSAHRIVLPERNVPTLATSNN